MKITIELNSGDIYTAQNEVEQIHDIARMVKGLLVQVGYHPESVDQLFGEDVENWFVDSDSSCCKNSDN